MSCSIGEIVEFRGPEVTSRVRGMVNVKVGGNPCHSSPPRSVIHTIDYSVSSVSSSALPSLRTGVWSVCYVRCVAVGNSS